MKPVGRLAPERRRLTTLAAGFPGKEGQAGAAMYPVLLFKA
jgi:hypothetical protein